MDISLLEKNIHNAEPVARTKLQQIPAVLVKRWVSILPIIPFHISMSVPKCALKSLKRILTSVDSAPWRASLISFTKA